MSHRGSPCEVNGRDINNGGDGGAGEIILFGVRVTVDSMRKSVSLNNLSQYEQPHQDPSPAAADVPSAAAGYASADDAVPQSAATRERKRGVPWTEEEHKLFLLGLQRVGKGDWRGISRNFVKTRTPTQVASHAQKYYLRRSNLSRRRRRSSLFDITTDSIVSMEEERAPADKNPPPPSFQSPEPYDAGKFLVPVVFPVAVPVKMEYPVENLTLGQGDSVIGPSSSSLSSSSSKLVRPAPVPSMNLDLNLNQQSSTAIDPLPLTLNLSLPSDQDQSAGQALCNFNNGDSVIIVA